MGFQLSHGRILREKHSIENATFKFDFGFLINQFARTQSRSDDGLIGTIKRPSGAKAD
ncbi:MULTISPECIES: hypothetical protein [Ochrobactrum]|uniref:hypothetical protein n=1 Tax=Ochrobactrum TaxID=528 RepID=UPI00178631BD|nr:MULTISPECIES: hypothetical protein [Brucella/Ochrobactrum group]MDH7792573.1 hypothetical protein [Ochrobactrum sp. AN78]